jgi:hypothetical protein
MPMSAPAKRRPNTKGNLDQNVWDYGNDDGIVYTFMKAESSKPRVMFNDESESETKKRYTSPYKVDHRYNENQNDCDRRQIEKRPLNFTSKNPKKPIFETIVQGDSQTQHKAKTNITILVYRW